MTTTILLGRAQLLAALKWLRDGRDLKFVAAALSIPADQIETAVREHGWPNREHVGYAVDEIETGKKRPAAPAPPPAAASTDETPVTGFASVRVDQVHPSPENPRERMTGIADLAASIAENGLIQPIVVQPDGDGGYRIIAGHRRHAAVQRLGWMHVEVLIRKPMRPDAELMTMLVENGQRAGLDPIEEARAIQRLISQGMTQHEVSRRIGRSPVHVNQRLLLLALPAEEQEALRAGQDTIGSALSKAKVASGRVGTGKGSKNPGWHFAHTHALATLAAARCNRLKHGRSRRVSGAIACGECWESVIRADERKHGHEHSARTGTCTTCGGSYNDAKEATT